MRTMPPPILVLTFSNQRGNSSTRRTGSQVSAGAMLTCCSSCKVKVTVKKVRNKRKVKYNAQDYWLEICQIHPWKSSLLIIVKCWKYKASQGHHEYSRSKIANKKNKVNPFIMLCIWCKILHISNSEAVGACEKYDGDMKYFWQWKRFLQNNERYAETISYI